MEDLFSQRPDGVIRVKISNAVMPFPAALLGPHAFGLLRYLALFMRRVLEGHCLGRKLEIHMATINLRSHDPMVINTL